MRLIDIMAAFEDIRAEEQNGTNVTGAAALQLIGEDCGPARPSAWPLTDANEEDARAAAGMGPQAVAVISKSRVKR
jgi:hypothetical protein